MKIVCSSWLGVAGGILALLGVVAAPITSGDTALRSARLIIAEFIKGWTASYSPNFSFRNGTGFL